MGKMFDEDGKADPDDLKEWSGLMTGTRRKVTDESNERAWVHRVESDSERSLNITPKTVDFHMSGD